MTEQQSNADGTVLVQFRGGPMDGLTEFSTDTQPLRLFVQPAIDQRMMMRMSEADIPTMTDGVLPVREYAYRRDPITPDGTRIYTYIGERTRT